MKEINKLETSNIEFDSKIKRLSPLLIKMKNIYMDKDGRLYKYDENTKKKCLVRRW